jgi:hypothetical protein
MPLSDFVVDGLLGDVTTLEASLEYLVRRVEGRWLMAANQSTYDSATGSPTSVQVSFSELRKIVREEIETAITPLKTNFSPIRTPRSQFSSVEGILPFDMMSEVQNSHESPGCATNFDTDESKGEFKTGLNILIQNS